MMREHYELIAQRSGDAAFMTLHVTSIVFSCIYDINSLADFPWFGETLALCVDSPAKLQPHGVLNFSVMRYEMA